MGCQIKSSSSSTSQFPMPVRAVYSFPNSDLFSIALLFIDKAMGNELIALKTMLTLNRVLEIVEFHRKSVNSIYAVKISSHYYLDFAYIGKKTSYLF